MDNILVNVLWGIQNEGEREKDLEENGYQSNELELDYNEDTDETLTIFVSGVDTFSETFVTENSIDFIDEKAQEQIKAYIHKELNPKLSLSEEIRMGGFKKPRFGDFIMLFTIEAFKTGHPLDPVDWDVRVETIGIIGEQVKLTY